MKYIESLIESLPELEPMTTGVTPKFHYDAGIKAVVFDIYGTLLVSSSGDVDQAEMTIDNLQRAFDASNIILVNHDRRTLQHILHDFKYTIEICHREAKKNDIPYPEIDILSIWEIVMLHARRKNLIAFNGDANIMRMTCTFEFLSNKVFPMPGMKNIIEFLKQKQLPLGIVSNAQFYTPVLMNYYLGAGVPLEEKIRNFDPDLTVFSYRLGRGKPDVGLFKELVPVFEKKYGIKPEEVLFVGNDMLKDIYASNQCGFKTALFAGDRRSLRMRSDDSRVKDLNPDFIITELKQLKGILST